MFEKLVVAIATLNVKYAGEPVYLSLSAILGLCAILSLGIISFFIIMIIAKPRKRVCKCNICTKLINIK